MRLPRSALVAGAVAVVAVAVGAVFVLGTRAGAGPEQPDSPAPLSSPAPQTEVEARQQRPEPTPQPFDASQLTPEATGFPIPGQPPPTLTPAGPPLPPSENLATFDDDRFDLTFDYPENWVVEVSAGRERNQGGFEVRNFTMGDGAHLDPDHVEVEIGIQPGALSGFASLQAWLDEKGPARRGPGISILSEKSQDVDGSPRIRFELTERGRTYTAEYFSSGEDIYVVHVFGTDSRYLAAAEAVVASIRVTSASQQNAD